MTAPGIALQLYTVRDAAQADLAGTLRRVRDAGWQYVQWSGMPALSASEIRAHLDSAGLVCVAGHDAVESFEGDFDGSVSHWQGVGASDIAPGGMMRDCVDDLEAWRKGCARLDALGARLRKAGMRLSYHNHAFELERFPEDARSKLDILYESTAPENLCAELDTAWLHVGGMDPAAYLRRCRGRCPVIHVKDVAAAERPTDSVAFRPLGAGVLDWPAVFEAAADAAVEWYIYEQDNHQGDLFKDVAASYAFLTENTAGRNA